MWRQNCFQPLKEAPRTTICLKKSEDTWQVDWSTEQTRPSCALPSTQTSSSFISTTAHYYFHIIRHSELGVRELSGSKGHPELIPSGDFFFLLDHLWQRGLCQALFVFILSSKSVGWADVLGDLFILFYFFLNRLPSSPCFNKETILISTLPDPFVSCQGTIFIHEPWGLWSSRWPVLGEAVDYFFYLLYFLRCSTVYSTCDSDDRVPRLS